MTADAQDRMNQGEILIEPNVRIRKVSVTGKVDLVFNTKMLSPPDISIFDKKKRRNRQLQ